MFENMITKTARKQFFLAALVLLFGINHHSSTVFAQATDAVEIEAWLNDSGAGGPDPDRLDFAVLDDGSCLVGGVRNPSIGLWHAETANSLKTVISPEEVQAKGRRLSGMLPREQARWFSPLFTDGDTCYSIVNYRKNATGSPKGIWLFNQRGEKCIIRDKGKVRLPSGEVEASSLRILSRSNRAVIFGFQSTKPSLFHYMNLSIERGLQHICSTGQFLSSEGDVYIERVYSPLLTEAGNAVLEAKLAGPGVPENSDNQMLFFDAGSGRLAAMPSTSGERLAEGRLELDRSDLTTTKIHDLLTINEDGQQSNDGRYLKLLKADGKIWSTADRRSAELVLGEGQQAPGVPNSVFGWGRVLAKTPDGNLLFEGKADIEKETSRARSLSGLWYYVVGSGVKLLMLEGQALPALGRGCAARRHPNGGVVQHVYRSGHVAIKTPFTGPRGSGNGYWLVNPTGDLKLVAGDKCDFTDNSGRTWNDISVRKNTLKFAEGNDRVYLWFQISGKGPKKRTLFRGSLRIDPDQTRKP